jgi:hypothetical protein
VKSLRRLPGAFFFIGSVVVLLSFGASAQNKTPLPGGLKEDSSVSQILTWLAQTSFPHARIVLKDSWDDFIYRPPWDDSEPMKHTFIFLQGFKVTNIDGCNLMLRHDDAREVIKSKEVDATRPLVVDLWVQLHRMSPDKGKRTHRYTTDPEKLRVLGAWKSEFKYKGWSSNTMAELKLNYPQCEKPQKWQGYNIAFTFDTQAMSEQFEVAFRHAIRLCRTK